MRPWEEALKEHKNALLKHGYKEENILGIFAYGSQNYQVETENSDWDTKAIIVPNYEKLIMNYPVSNEIHLPNGEHCEVKDIREIASMFKKQNINFLEILFTDYKWLNPYYARLWEFYFESKKEDIAHYDVNKTVQSICGQAIHTLNQNPFNGKKIANGYRLLQFLERYLAGVNYRDCIVLPAYEREKIINWKKIEELDDSFIGHNLVENFLHLKEQKHPIDRNYMETVDKIITEGVLRIINYHLINQSEFYCFPTQFDFIKK